MKELHTSLFRERFLIHDPHAEPGSNQESFVALSNRIEIDLPYGKDLSEVLVIRAQNMHSCVRMTARLVQAFQQSGPLLSRHTPFDWDKAWDGVVNDYEYSFNPQRWVCIYHEGRPVFERGMRHPLLDVIEKCDQQNDDVYDISILMAEEAFRKTGKVVSIEYDGNVALAVNLEHNEGRIGVILRKPNRSTTFNYSITAPKDSALNFPQCLGSAAAFLEGIQLAFMVGFNEVKIASGRIERFSKEEKQTTEAKKRLGRLRSEINNLESKFTVHYRPEKPEFHHILADSESLARKVLAPDEEVEDEETKEKDGKKPS